MNTARIRRAEKLMIALDPMTRVGRYWDALSSGNGQAHRLLETMPDEQREAFQRACLATGAVVRVLPHAENLLLRVQNHVLIAARPTPIPGPEVDAWLETVRGLWSELLAFEQFRNHAFDITGLNEPITVMSNLLAQTRRVLLAVKTALTPELMGMERVGADPEMVGALERLLVA